MNRLKVWRLAVLVFFIGIGPEPAFSQSAFTAGEELLMQNKPAEALTYLEAAVAEDPAHVQAFVYLAIVYQQLDRAADAIAAYRRILPRAGGESAKIAFNMGNIFFSGGNAEEAALCYSEAIEIDPAMASAWLNRANSRIKTGALKEAIADYTQYLAIEPLSPQRGKIEQLIYFINDEFAAEEKRIAREAEAARLEMERRQRILKEVSSSLQAAAEDSKGLSAGAEDIQGYEGEFELE